jgi:hypothetical protein
MENILTSKYTHANIVTWRYKMKNKIFALMIVAILLISSLSTAFAGGGQVRGEEGQGPVNQVQVQDPPPFQ